MRVEFVEELVGLAERDPSIVLLTGDLGFSVVEPFAERFPDRFFNVGVAEQNMLGIATGLAEAGYTPYVYSIATFASLRPYEFIRNGALLHELPIRIVGVGAGFDYGHNGVTHFALEDVALMRIQPRMTVVAPADSVQARSAFRATATLSNPVYYRLSKSSSSLPALAGRFALGRADVLREGDEVALVALGTSVAEALDAAQILEEQGVLSSVVAVTTFNPSPSDDVRRALAAVPVAVTVEEHYVDGGLGSFVSEVVAEAGLDCRVVRLGVRTMPTGRTGSAEWLRSEYGLDGPAVASAASAALVEPTRRDRH